jgi:iron only hydrogenase large subunit-like protein
VTTSCCASYNQFIKTHLPEIKTFVSSTQTPLYYIAQKVKNKNPDATTVFISPCVAKKLKRTANNNINYVINYEELGALFIVKNINIQDCEEKFDIESSIQGRGFGVTGGVAGAVAKILESKDLVKSCMINGLNKETVKQLKNTSRAKSVQEAI